MWLRAECAGVIKLTAGLPVPAVPPEAGQDDKKKRVLGLAYH